MAKLTTSHAVVDKEVWEPRAASSWLPPLLLSFAYLTLCVAWIFANPPGQAPDEPSHFRKALGVAAGEPLGRPARQPLSPSDPPTLAWVKRTTRAVEIPPGLSPLGLSCHAHFSKQSARCQYDIRPLRIPTLELTNVGTAQPSAYVLPGLLGRTAGKAVPAVRLARLGASVLPMGLLALSAALLWDRSATISLAGLVVAVTPMVVFLSSSLGASGLEVTGAICFTASLLRVTRATECPKWVWVAMTVSGVSLACSRTLGPLWVALALAIVVVARGHGPSWAAAKSAPRRAVLAFGAVTASIIFCLWWEVAFQPRGSTTLGGLYGALATSLREYPATLRQLVGVFGSLDAPMPRAAYNAWFLLLALLLLVALLLGSWRERAVLALLLPGLLSVSLAIAVLNRSMTGFGMQGRYVLPIAVTLPLLAGEVLSGKRSRLARVSSLRALIGFALLLAAGVHALGWYANARRSAVGTDGPWFFLASSEWAPWGGWYVWMTVVGLASILFLATALMCAASAFRSARPRES